MIFSKMFRGFGRGLAGVVNYSWSLVVFYLASKYISDGQIVEMVRVDAMWDILDSLVVAAVIGRFYNKKVKQDGMGLLLLGILAATIISTAVTQSIGVLCFWLFLLVSSYTEYVEEKAMREKYDWILLCNILMVGGVGLSSWIGYNYIQADIKGWEQVYLYTFIGVIFFELLPKLVLWRVPFRKVYEFKGISTKAWWIKEAKGIKHGLVINQDMWIMRAIMRIVDVNVTYISKDLALISGFVVLDKLCQGLTGARLFVDNMYKHEIVLSDGKAKTNSERLFVYLVFYVIFAISSVYYIVNNGLDYTIFGFWLLVRTFIWNSKLYYFKGEQVLKIVGRVNVLRNVRFGDFGINLLFSVLAIQLGSLPVYFIGMLLSNAFLCAVIQYYYKKYLKEHDGEIIPVK